jgi:hypothetical protein
MCSSHTGRQERGDHISKPCECGLEEKARRRNGKLIFVNSDFALNTKRRKSWELALKDTQVTDSGVNELTKALPNCRIAR